MGTYSKLAASNNVFSKESEKNLIEKPLNTPNSSANQEEPTSPTSSLSKTLSYKRRTKRYSFEFYEDQIFSIKRLIYEAHLTGENISQSDIVRQALDEFLDKRK